MGNARPCVGMSMCSFLLFFFIILHNCVTCFCFNIKLSTLDSVGSCVFNASHGRGWSYRIEPISTSLKARGFLTLDSSTGAVYLSTRVKCSDVTFGPLHYRIISRKNSHHHKRLRKTHANSTDTTLTVTIEGTNCLFVPNHLKYSSQIPYTKYKHYVSLFSKLLEDNNNCLQSGQTVLKLEENIPSSITNCDHFVNSVDSPYISYNKSTDELLVSKDFCTIDHHVSFSSRLLVFCTNMVTDMELEIVIKPTKTPQNENMSFLEFGSPSPRIRLRRNADYNKAPVFPSMTYTKTVDEEQNPGVHVITITATDPDTGDAGVLTYSLSALNDQRSIEMFAIQPSSGSITTTKRLDREVIPEHKLQVIATDNGYPNRRSAQTFLTIKVKDINDHKPVFEESVYYRNISESAAVSTPVLSVKATDRDSGKNAEIRYRLISSSNRAFDYFMIDPLSGSITTKKLLNREETAEYKFTVQATDQGSDQKQSASTSVNIFVLDENDNYPQFTQRTYHVEVPEDYDYISAPVVAQVTATDLDAGVNKIIIYSIFGGNMDTTFRIDRNTGELFIVKPLDREKHPQFNVQIRAQDGGSPMRSNTTTVVVKVTDVNDNDPEIFGAPYLCDVEENAKVGFVVRQIQAQDVDEGSNGEIEFQISGVPDLSSFPFNLNSDSGIITVKSALDRETVDFYSFIVNVTDKGTTPRSATARVEITIRDVNDKAPKFEQKLYNASVSEEAKQGSNVILVRATDDDMGNNARLDYSIVGGNTNNAFRIAAINGAGQIMVAGNLDYKLISHYYLTVRAQDRGQDPLYDSTEVRVVILDTNQHTPVFQGTPYSFNVEENTQIGKSIFKVFAKDEDVGENARITYEIQGTSTFSIDHTTGVISTRVSIDREQKYVESFPVTARDHGKPSRTATTDVTVTITDVNDNAPEFSKDRYEGEISEDAEVGQSVLHISATDLDVGINAALVYTFNGGNSGGNSFSIDDASGTIRVRKKLDRETVSVYNLVAFAVDKGVPSRSTSVEITIKILDINDNAPVFPSRDIQVRVMENTPLYSVIAQISAVDPDEGVNAEVEYVKVGGWDSESFKLEFRPGGPAIIKNEVELDYESDKKVYQILLRANSAPFFSEAMVFIMVQDVNDNKPVLKDFTIIFNNYENRFISGVIGRIPATDPDELDRSRLEYQFFAGNDADFLHLNQSSGELTLNGMLNSDVPRNGTMQVKVSDGKNEVKATCHLYVRLVTDEMLRNSVTIRLNNMTQNAFLSPLYKFYVDALATIMGVEEKDIFVINIQNDTDVQAQILNVSVSVKKADGTFFSAEYLREQIYLQRILLANLSTLQVLPFDDNLCVIEPCLNFDSCGSKLRFGKASPFISSDMMLFRSIHPQNDYTCFCPTGFTGNESFLMCDTEVDLCYSNPCKNDGNCIRREGGYSCHCAPNFAGEFCEYNLTKKYDLVTCPHQLCRPPSRCVPLIKGGFRCQDCPNEPHLNQFCQLTTRRFPKGSFLTFPSLKRKNRFTIQLQFATQKKNGLLFYNGRFNEKHDFIALEIIDGQVQFSFSLGSNITTVSSNIQHGVNDGAWHMVKVQYHNRTVKLTVGEDCDTQINILYGSKLSNYTCAVQVEHVLHSKCALYTKLCHRLLDLTGPLQIGGLPKLPSTFQIQNKDFEGCIKDVYIDNDLLDLNMSVSNVGTQPGCAEKKSFCLSSPCKNAGKCIDAWGGYLCECGAKKGGKSCEQAIDEPRMLDGSAFLMYSENSFPKRIVQLTWYNGLSFRTRAESGVLMHIIVTGGHTMLMELEGGYLHYTYNYDSVDQKFILDSVKVNDGRWHYFEVRWMENNKQLYLILDYGIWMKTGVVHGDIENKNIERVYVGAQRIGNGPMQKGFKGCVQSVIVGSNYNSFLRKPSGNNDVQGCTIGNPCDSNPCSNGATCQNQWGSYKCICPPGTIGPKCEDICQNYNPCQNWANCRGPTFGVASERNYTCECGKLQRGQYCEVVSEQPCPVSWYGYPICGPCNCDTKQGFNTSCDKKTGKCSCKNTYYKPAGSDRCIPCDCYSLGSKSLSCNQETGQCNCLDTVVGRRCDQCKSKYAEVTLTREGCKVNYYMCPRTYTADMWWAGTPYGNKSVQDCPYGAKGEGTRECTKDGNWKEPNLFNCVNKAFYDLQQQLTDLETGEITTYVAKKTIANLHMAIVNTKTLFGNDVNMTFRILNLTLEYETKQTGLGLTSERDSKYIQRMLEILSKVVDPKYHKYWKVINGQSGGSALLLWKLEKYLALLSENLAMLQSKPYSIITDNIVLVMDNISKQNFSGQKIPKFDNIVHSSTFDDDTFFYLPKSTLSDPSAEEMLNQIYNNRYIPSAVVGYVMYKTFGDVMPSNFASDVREIRDRPLDMNTPMISLIVRDRGDIVTGTLTDPIKITFKQQLTVNRTSPQCVYWKSSSDGSAGYWSTDGCTVEKRYEVAVPQNGKDAVSELYIVCSCNHMTTFGVLMDVAEKEYVAKAAISLVIFSFIGIGISLACLFVAYFIFLCFKHLQSNANSILINLVFTIFIAEFSFIVGVYRVEPQLLCRLISIALHYFYLSAFSWLFVEMLHIYRRLTEIREINYGSMKFYYLIGYVIPGIVVGLSVGLYTDGYGGTAFCWLDMTQPFIWSFAGPVVLAVVVIIVTFVLALRATCHEKLHVSDVSAFRVRTFCGVVVLLLLGLTWILGLVSVNLNYSSLHYVYAVFAFAQGIFLFIAYIIFDRKVRQQLKKQWYRCQGKKLDMEEHLAPRGSRSALAYRQDSSEGYLNHTGINVGISTTSTTSRSTSKSSGGLYKGENYLRSTSTSTSGQVPSESMYPPNTGIPPYGYDSKAYHEKRPNDPDTVVIPNKHAGNDSDSDSDASVGHNSLSLASSHSSDEDDEIDFGNNWEKQLPVNKKVEEAKEEARKKKKERDKIEADKQINTVTQQQIYNTGVQHHYGHWPGDPNLSGFHMSESDYRPSDQHTMSSNPPDVLPTLPAQELQGNRDYIIPPIRTDSLLNESSTGSPRDILPPSLDPRKKVQVLTHNGSISSDDSECSHETSV